ncbi:hypothetical protein [Pseudomonas monteilii]|uniref:Uncharacterized protein n=1 Tax=Pseudomonas monteilii TaxID=76759 RepID=A0A399LYM5_9PSED|nr:hypothetical protein [Pseudomonas monteilii]RII74671.1 hypothetical protein D0894_25295 [Pseudomonas monteilii]
MSEIQQPANLNDAVALLDGLSQLGKVEEISNDERQSLADQVDKLLGVQGAFNKWREKAKYSK